MADAHKNFAYSTVAAFSHVLGILAAVFTGKTYTLSKQPDPPYNNNPSTTLTDGNLGNPNPGSFGDGSWDGWHNLGATLLDVTIDLGASTGRYTELKVSANHNPGVGIVRPAQIEFFTSADNITFTSRGVVTSAQSVNDAGARFIYTVSGLNLTDRFVRYRITAAGEWTFLGETYGTGLSSPESDKVTVASGDGALFPVAPFNVTIWPTGAQPTASNAEIARVISVAGDVLTITRAQEGSTKRVILVGDQIAATITVKSLTDLEDVISTAGGLGFSNDNTEHTVVSATVSPGTFRAGSVIEFLMHIAVNAAFGSEGLTIRLYVGATAYVVDSSVISFSTNYPFLVQAYLMIEKSGDSGLFTISFKKSLQSSNLTATPPVSAADVPGDKITYLLVDQAIDTTVSQIVKMTVQQSVASVNEILNVRCAQMVARY
jgi:hypothetical protein